MMARPDSLGISLNEWVNQGNSLSRADVSVAIIHLRRRRMYNKALQLLEWLESTKFHNFVEQDYACHLNLIAKTHGLQEAEIYLDKVPKAFKGEVVYRTLLANYVAPANVNKAEEVFHRMRDLGFPISAFAYTQLLLLYRKTNRKKIPDVLLIMEKDNVKPTLLMYKILIDVKGLSRDIVGMEKVLENMKAESIVPDNALRAMIACHYIAAGFNTKAEKIMKEIENDCRRGNSDAWRFLLPFMLPKAKLMMSNECEVV
ncbi:hypothetical protein HPP92_017783 [Vanilla planifolia]|uniref:Pentatricopeptide repeat-containing protein n=1 Tax=Vanilla planifolia TaxID=51239 RepID=A0A835Q8K9_VANPL|nr:hypothetical protein HPP92_017783 [Vanilla planifolia]